MKTQIENTDENKIKALASFLGCDEGDISKENFDRYGVDVFSVGREEYCVGTDDEADVAWLASLESYIEECIEPELNFDKLGSLGDYVKFDREMWLRDAKMDGRGHSLSSYDGEENEQDGFYIYRTN